MNIKKHLPAVSGFLVLTVIIIFSWFKAGYIYGGGDVGLTTYNPQRIAQVISKIWWEDTAPGFPRPQGLASLPAELALSLLQRLSLPDFVIQAVLFGFILFSMGIGMYFLSLEIVSKDKKIAFLAAFFYLVNPYMMVQVWHRFIHSTFFLAGALPSLLLFWKRWIEGGRLINLILFLLTNFIFSFMFSTLAYMVTVWLLLFYFVIFEMFVPWKGRRHFLALIAKALAGFAFWILTNVWWLGPISLVSPSLLSVQHSIIGSILTLQAISSQAIIPYSLSLLNPFYLFYQKEFGSVYSNFLFLALPFLYMAIIFIGIYSSLKKRPLIFFAGLFLIAVFLAKGISTPFGALFLLGFAKSFIIGVLRNPFEKVGILLPFSASFLFAVGFVRLWEFFNRKKIFLGKAVLAFAFVMIFVIYHLPFWTGAHLGTPVKSNFVKIPDDYLAANDWIKAQNKSGNILHLPTLVSEGLTYNWQYGYSGVDSTTDFFTSNPSLSMGFNLFHIDTAIKSLDLLTEITTDEEIKLKSLLGAFNVRFLVLHQDINWQKSKTKDPLKVKKRLDKLSFLVKKEEFGSLTIYEIKDEDFMPKLFITDAVDYLSGFTADTPDFKSAWAWYGRTDASRLLLSADNLKEGEKGSIILLPKISLNFYPQEKLDAQDALRRLPAVRFLPDSLFYKLIRLKEKMQLWGLNNMLSNAELEFAGKRLVEAYRLILKNSPKGIAEVIKDYINILPVAMSKLDMITKTTSPNKEISGEAKSILNNHSIVLRELLLLAREEDKDVLLKADDLLLKFKIQYGVDLLYQVGASESANLTKQVFRYDIPKDAAYELLLADYGTSSLYEDNLRMFDFLINGQRKARTGQRNSSFLSYGFIDLKKGPAEISFPKIYSRNLVKNPKDKKEIIEITSARHEPKSFDSEVEPFEPGGTYAVFFDFLLVRGNDPVVRISQDSDPQDLLGFDPEGQNSRLYEYNQQVLADLYNRSWRPFVYFFNSRENSNKLTLQIEAIPWNDCAKQLAGKNKLCKKSAIRQQYERPSTVAIRDVRVFKVLNNPLFLRLKEDASQSAGVTKIDYEKPKLLTYKGDLEIDKPMYLVFGETFDKEWELTLTGPLSSFRPAVHLPANMYANAWYIEEPGKYEFSLEYKPQKYFYYGIYIGIASFMVLIAFSLFLKKGQDEA